MNISMQTRQRLLAWWNNTGYDDRPCILAQLPADSKEPVESYTADEFWLKPELMTRVRTAHMHNTQYIGEATPYLYMDYGANAMGLQLGAHGRWIDTETIWTDSCVDSVGEIENCLPGGRWRDIEEAAIQMGISACAGEAVLSSFCLGAPADLSAALLGTENLLYALMDEPDAVARAFEHIKRVIIAEFKKLERQCEAGGTVLGGWHGIWAPRATTPIQEDFSYMIGNDMFNKFCLTHIREIASEVPYAFYHLDGVGALKHLDALLDVEELRVIQWQPGEGHMSMGQWVDVVRKILDGGKSCQVYASVADMELLTREVGAEKMLYIIADTEENVRRMADKYSLEAYNW